MKTQTTHNNFTDSSLATFPLLYVFVCIWQEMLPAFAQSRIHNLGLDIALGLLTALGRRTISRGICARAAQHKDWSRFYRFFSKDIWFPVIITHQLLAHISHYLQDDAPLVIGIDDTSTDKTGRKIPASSYFYDPRSPVWARAYKWALRFISFSALITPYGPITPAKGILIKLKLAPVLVKPKKKDPPKVHKKYNKDKKNWSLSTQAIEQILLLRAQMDNIESLAKRLLVIVADASYTNEIIFRNLPSRCIYIGRTRKDLKLFAPANTHPGAKGRTKKYGDQLPTPQEIRRSENYLWQECTIFAAGKWHHLRYKVVKDVLWEKAGYCRPVMLIIIAPLAYRLRKYSKTLYRDPAYLLVSDPTYNAVSAIQHYFHRWQIEVNHRDAKVDFGVGDAQVRHPRSVSRQFNFAALVSSMLALASLDAYGCDRTNNYIPQAKWRNDPRSRPSAIDLKSQFRQELWLYEAGEQVISFSTPSHLAPKHPKYVENATAWLAQTVPKGLSITAWSAILHADA
jgi:hypothetical protein